MAARNRKRHIKVVWYTCKKCNDMRESTKLTGWIGYHSPDSGTICQRCLDQRREIVTQQHLDYLTIIEKEGKNIDDPTYLMQAFSVTEEHARVIIAHWQNTVTEYQDAMFDAGAGYGR